MTDTDALTPAERDILSVLPERAHDLTRLRTLNSDDDRPVVTVVGKYNHGKSRLLNELVGNDVFSVADKRETVTLAEHVHSGVRWLDAPGLDADVGTADDHLAAQAAWLHSDIRLVVHAAKEGELDADERTLLQQLYSDSARTHRQTLLVLTQVDQLADDAELNHIKSAIKAQAPDMTLHLVSSSRHDKGIREGKALLIEKSGIPTLKATLLKAIERVPQARDYEKSKRVESIRLELQQRSKSHAQTLETLQQEQRQRRQNFDTDMGAAFAKLAQDIQAVLDVPGVDHSLTPDSNEDRYKLTAGKLERARLQIAYSNACIYLNGVLTRHGVIGLPTQQQTAAASLNTVMVAVMGVSVKYRKDLHRMFCTTSGQNTLHQQFAHYFELSSDRQTLRKRIATTESDRAATELALHAVHELDAATPA